MMYTDSRLITLTTDFGRGYYPAQMRGVIKKVNDKAEVVDVTHDVGRHDIVEGAFILSRITGYYPDNTVHVAVVDPGVGTDRAALAVETKRFTLIGPDNGVLKWALNGHDTVRVVALDEETVKERAGFGEVSNTFHGRDVFAPAAALITKGVDVDALGKRVDEIEKLNVKQDRVVHVDGFGNIVTTMAAEPAPGETVKVAHKGRMHDAFCVKTYGQARPGQLVVLTGSHGLLEVAVREGDAASLLGAKAGDEILMQDAG